jgi:hypothetical protein
MNQFSASCEKLIITVIGYELKDLGLVPSGAVSCHYSVQTESGTNPKFLLTQRVLKVHYSG